MGGVFHHAGCFLESQPNRNASGRELELELIRVRAEATAARLEARAAELEMLLLAQKTSSRIDIAAENIRESSRSGNGNGHGASHGDAAEALILAIRRLVEQSSVGPPSDVASVGPEPQRFAAGNGSGWESRLSAVRGRQVDSPADASPVSRVDGERSAEAGIEDFANRIASASRITSEAVSSPISVPQPAASDRTASEHTASQLAASEPAKSEPASPLPVAGDTKKTRVDSASAPVKRPHLLDLATLEKPAAAIPLEAAAAAKRSSAKPLPISINEDSPDSEKPKRWRPAGWLVSTTAHVVGLIVLGLFTLTNPKPKDQLAFTASVSEASESAVESFTIEAAEEMPDVSEPAVTETAADVSPLGTMQMAEVSLDLPTAAAPPMNSPMSAEMSSKSMKLAKASVKGDTLSKVQFAGLDGGGNHFVYLVDSSNSMRKFNDARTELLRSIDSLKPDQRFYVVFYDENPKFMRIANPGEDEPASVYATAENKQAFRRWAMAVQQARGQSPPEVLKFAFKLRPDVIFLLSDGEFTAQTETVIRENNVQENLFGESGPISIIHTIRYPGVSTTEGRQAEVQMQRIAAENGGQYRNVEIK